MKETEAEVSEQVGVGKGIRREETKGARPVIESQSDCRGLTRHVKGAETNGLEPTREVRKEIDRRKMCC